MKYERSDMERARAQAFSSAADTACNQWNLLDRTKVWCAMTGPFQAIWKNLKHISDDYHRLADEFQVREAQEAEETQ